MRTHLNMTDFREALRALDGELRARAAEPLEIRALGGFALLAHGLRETGFTADIDTATPDPTRAQQGAIDAVARRLDLPPDWVNNDVVMASGRETTWEDVDALDVMLDADYEPLDVGEGLARVSVSVCSLETLAKAKAYACDDIGRGRTPKDADDLMETLVALGIGSLSQARRRLPWMSDPEFSAARDVVRSREEALSRLVRTGEGQRDRTRGQAIGADPARASEAARAASEAVSARMRAGGGIGRPRDDI